MKIAILYDKFREDTLGEYYRRALIKKGHSVDHFWIRRGHIVKPGYDLYFRVDDGDYKFDIPHKKLRPAIFYASDVHLAKPFRAIRRLVGHYNHVFCAQYDGYMRLRKEFSRKVSWLPHAADSGLHADIRIERDLDIGFIGNDGGVPRKFLLQELRERYPNSFIGPAKSTEISGIYSRSRIVFNYSINNDLNMRMFEAMAGGAMLLTNFIKGNGFDEIFKDRENLVLYKTPREIFELIDHYLKNPGERERIAGEGKGLALKDHTYDNRIEEVLRHV